MPAAEAAGLGPSLAAQYSTVLTLWRRFGQNESIAMSNDMEAGPQRRLFLLLDLLGRKVDAHPTQQTFSLSEDELTRFSSDLHDPNSVEIALNKIATSSAELISIKRITTPLPPVRRAEELTMVAHGIPDYFSVHIEDVRGIHLARQALQTNRTSNILFVIEERGNKATIYKQNDRSRTHDFYISADKYQILKAIVEARDYVSTQTLTTDDNPQRTRKIIGEIRKSISRALNVPVDEVIENDPGRGYRFLNVTFSGS